VEAVVGRDEGVQPSLQVGGGAEVGIPQEPPDERPEPHRDLVEPAGVEGEVVEVQAAGMSGLPVGEGRTPVSVEVVHHGMDHLSGGNVGMEPVEEAGEHLGGAPGGDQAEDVAGMDLEAGGEAAGAVANVLRFALDEFARATQGQFGMTALQSLDRGLLVEAPDRPVGGGIEVEVDDGADARTGSA
jgi:hypothetical protein